MDILLDRILGNILIIDKIFINRIIESIICCRIICNNSSKLLYNSICHGTRSGGSINVVALTIVYNRILHEGAKRCEGTSTLYTVGCQGSLRAARPESVTYTPLKLKEEYSIIWLYYN